MSRCRLRFLCKLPGVRRLSAALWGIGLPLGALGCAGAMPLSASMPPPVVRAAATAEIQPVMEPAKPEPINKTPTPAPASAPAIHMVPISLDTVLRLAPAQNAKVNVARQQVAEAFADKAVAANRWLPDVWVGTSYYRHEGGIQNPDGTFIHSSFGSLFGGVEIDSQFDIREFAYQKVNAQRRVWQQCGELSRVTSETLLDAAGTYIDLLAAVQGEAIIRATDATIHKLLRDAENLARTEPGTRIEVIRVKAEIAGRKQLAHKLRGQAAAARAKLAYALGMNPNCALVPVDNRLGALSLVDASPAVADLVNQALATGPGIREMEGLLALVQESIEKAQGPSRYMPVIGLHMAEGAFGGGPGDDSQWDNRWDLCFQVRWNLTQFVSASDRQRAAQAKLNQLNLSYQDLRGKLTAGVQEARSAILSGLEQLRAGEEQIQYTQDTVRRSQERLQDLPPERKTPSEVLLSLRSQMGAQLNYLSILREYDKAQLRLLVLLGLATAPEENHCGNH